MFINIDNNLIHGAEKYLKILDNTIIRKKNIKTENDDFLKYEDEMSANIFKYKIDELEAGKK